MGARQAVMDTLDVVMDKLTSGVSCRVTACRGGTTNVMDKLLNLHEP